MFSEHIWWLILVYLWFTEALDVNESSTTTTTTTQSSVTSFITPSSTNNVSMPPEISIIHLNVSRTEEHVIENTESSGEIAGIVIAVLCVFGAIIGTISWVILRHMRKGATSMNFDNPVYRKTTEDQFSLEKNQYLPARSYPSSLEPLTSPGTNEFV